MKSCFVFSLYSHAIAILRILVYVPSEQHYEQSPAGCYSAEIGPEGDGAALLTPEGQ